MEKELLRGRDGEALLRLVKSQKYNRVIELGSCCKCGCHYRIGYHYQNETSETYLCQDCSRKYDPKYMYAKPRFITNSIDSNRRKH